MENFNLREVPRLIASILIVFFSGAVGSLATFPEITTWYAALAKPAWTPPNEWFGPIWTTLYILIGIALFLVWRQGWDRRDVRFAIGIFAVQLVLNILWSLVFFGLHSILGGFIIIFLLWIAILANMVAFYVLSKPAGLLLVPYIIWVSIASYLNYSVMLLN
ncbi:MULTISPECIES: TspO/MBR family protein [Methanobacterium]|jgi:tryptophan-rich sensory protein|uniref:Tryptophan-rich sensory protein n=1 Tax=Methanobacterium formicicum TaxID=2162 RepID=A0A843AML6_METFO|nr:MULTISPECIES: TspO/MBR family protein [Methanobacterium]KUK73462.1 MAG: TspO and MBR-like protein [Methanobacterium sp. 42_16]MBF4475046.1 tryptophan-rich sensory protein [Methanobacterium formicicum]MDD4810418.1 tryptophan-rich sensory protein [Methanobacterium formicicum]